MNDANLSNVEGPPPTLPPRENRVFKGQAVPFVLLRICIFIALATGISFALQWIAAGLSGGERSIYSPRNLALSEGALMAGALAAGLIMSQLEGRPFGDYGLPVRWAFGKLFWQGALLGVIEIRAVWGFRGALACYHLGGLAFQGAKVFNGAFS